MCPERFVTHVSGRSTQKPPLAGRAENLPCFNDMRRLRTNWRSLAGHGLPRMHGFRGPVSRPKNGFSVRCPPTAAETGSHMVETWFASSHPTLCNVAPNPCASGTRQGPQILDYSGRRPDANDSKGDMRVANTSHR